MRVFGRRARLDPTTQAPVAVPPPMRVLRADGQRIDLTSRDVGKLLTATRQSWQFLVAEARRPTAAAVGPVGATS